MALNGLYRADVPLSNFSLTGVGRLSGSYGVSGEAPYCTSFSVRCQEGHYDEFAPELHIWA